VSVNAATITLTFDVELLADWITPTLDNAGNPGKQFELPPQSVDPFFVQTGDVIITHVNFLSPFALKITDLNDDFWSSSTGSATGLEPIGFHYWYSDGTSGTGSNSTASIFSSITWDVLAGAANPLSNSYTSAGAAVGAMSKLTGSNITDSIAVIMGFTIQTNINSYTLNRNDGEIGTFNGSILAGDIQLAPIPIPAAVWLFGSALGLLGLLRRGKR
jgi:hypothetical protein